MNSKNKSGGDYWLTDEILEKALGPIQPQAPFRENKGVTKSKARKARLTGITIYLEDTHDGHHYVCPSSRDFWDQLVAPAVKAKHPIDGATVDRRLLEKLFRMSPQRTRTIPESAQYVIPLV